MKKSVIIWLIVAASLILLGSALIGISFVNEGDVLGMLNTKNYETSTYSITGTFTHILITDSDADIYILPSEDSLCRVECYEFIRGRHSVGVEGATLTVKEINERKWYDYIGISFTSPEVKIYLPEAQYGALTIDVSTGKISAPPDFSFGDVNIKSSTGDVKFFSSAADLNIKSSTGDITLNSIKADNVSLTLSTGKISVSGLNATGDVLVNVSTGHIYISDTRAKALTSKGSTGDINLSDTVISGKISLERSTGDVEFSRCDAGELYIETSTGDIEGTLLSEKVFVTHSGTGDIEVPKTYNGGKCEVTTSTGDIEIDIVG